MLFQSYFSDSLKNCFFCKPQIYIGISYLTQALLNPFSFDSNVQFYSLYDILGGILTQILMASSVLSGLIMSHQP